jgi:hypothetical protein
MSAGVNLLREYFLKLGSIKAAVIAYNAGPANYKRGKYRLDYWKKFQEHKHVYARYLESQGSSEWSAGSTLPVRSPDLDLWLRDVESGLDASRLLFASNRQTRRRGEDGQDADSYPQHCPAEETRESLGSLKGE